MAEELSITTSAYSKIERGDTDASASRLMQIAETLGVSVTDFFEDAVAEFRENSSNYGFATKEELDALNRTVHALVREIEKLREDLPLVKTTSKKKK